ncbi:transcriptional regulator with sigma factor-related N-terminal domain [Halobacteroides halobius DSM 5150]|uniref:Transcriptional regulator with sigma factor-related N-terminal domain n=1 Tax=Halobacteroides halobius (strain ATCC 35273 / DSM 5150 / MD-1) TaxID=748449 RepID=L0KBR9_HALHC|nr:sugar-binding domain-containing protein [Halobacteroides halobius]AGB41995.1 transcriptional regulator with sigma factor-related N-terminal domain [Halobacteroides halobius DSM 5150]
MTNYFKLQQKIAPELVKIIDRRYMILKMIYRFKPIGRRSLAKKLGLSERTVRKNLNFLKEKQFISTTNAGAQITEAGIRILSDLDGYIKELRGTKDLERKLAKVLGVEVHIVPQGPNYNQSKCELGRFSAEFLTELVGPKDIIAVTGGTTLATVAKMMTPLKKKLDVNVVPGRGGLGEQVEIQANTIAAKIANKLGGEYHLLHIPDNLKADTISQLVIEPSIKHILDLAKSADILVHGVGTAQVMAKRRKMSTSKIKKLEEKGAVGESFGYYFNQAGQIVYSTASVGLKLSDLVKIKKVIAIAGGEYKAEAILAAVSDKYQDVLITDEEAANKILNLV